MVGFIHLPPELPKFLVKASSVLNCQEEAIDSDRYGHPGIRSSAFFFF